MLFARSLPSPRPISSAGDALLPRTRDLLRAEARALAAVRADRRALRVDVITVLDATTAIETVNPATIDATSGAVPLPATPLAKGIRTARVLDEPLPAAHRSRAPPAPRGRGHAGRARRSPQLDVRERASRTNRRRDGSADAGRVPAQDAGRIAAGHDKGREDALSGGCRGRRRGTLSAAGLEDPCLSPTFTEAGFKAGRHDRRRRGRRRRCYSAGCRSRPSPGNRASSSSIR